MVRWLSLFSGQGHGFIDDLTEAFYGEDGQAIWRRSEKKWFIPMETPDLLLTFSKARG